MENALLANAIASYRAGDLTMAHSLLEVELHVHPEQAEAWLWMSRVAEQPEERVWCLQRALSLKPGYRVALSALLLATHAPAPIEELPLPSRMPPAVEPRGPALPSQLRGAARRAIGFAGIAAAALFFVLMASATIPMFAGDRALAVLSGSMEPAIHTGSAVIAQPVPSEDLRVGDVIVFSPSPQAELPLVHRIVKIREQGGVKYYATRGDANRSGDVAEVSLPQTAWRVWYGVPWAGYVISFASGSIGRLFLVLIPLGGLVVMNLADWLKCHLRSRAFCPGQRRAAAG